MQQKRHWEASLELTLACRAGRTRLVHRRRVGPLGIQRPFYEGTRQQCQLYLLHPPGGVVAGDLINLRLHAEQDTDALLTTPGAGKVYQTDSAGHWQTQQVELHLMPGARLDWFPQETILYDGARFRSRVHIRLAAGAGLNYQEIFCFGRHGRSGDFPNGALDSRLSIDDAVGPLFRDMLRLSPRSALTGSAAGLQHQPVAGLFVHVAPEGNVGRDGLEAARQALDAAGSRFTRCTLRGRLLLGRYLGPHAEDARNDFKTLWMTLATDRPVLPPRIWNT
jgi:urease accessory protein